MLRAVFGPFEMDVYRIRLDCEVGPVEQTLVRFKLSPALLRAVANVAFHSSFLFSSRRACVSNVRDQARKAPRVTGRELAAHPSYGVLGRVRGV